MVVALALLGALFGLTIPIASGILVDQVIPAADLPRLGVICLFLLVLTGSASIFQAMQWLMVLRIEGRVSATLIPAVWDRLLRLPSRFFARFSSGDLALRAMGLSEIFKKVSGAVVSTIVTGFFSCCNLGLLYYYNWRLALCTTVLLGLMFLVTALLLSGLLRQETSIRRIDGSISGLLLELLGGMITLRSGGAESRAFARWARLYTERLALSIRARRYSNRIHQWLSVYPILTAMVIYFGAIHFDQALMRAGDFLAFTITFANLMSAVLAVGYTSISLLDLLPMFERIKPILEEGPEFPAAVVEPVRLAGALALNHVSFRYPGQDRGTQVLDNVSLQVRPGEFVAIVGPSGSGKSTLVRLLLGFEVPDSGTVTYDGRELPTLDCTGFATTDRRRPPECATHAERHLQQYRGLRSLLEHGRRLAGSAAGRPRRRHPRDAHGDAHPGRRSGREPVERSAPAFAHRPGDRAPAQDPPARRGDQRAR